MNEVSNCCHAPMIEPDEDEIETAGSLWRAYACYICKECGKPCEPIKIDHYDIQN